MWLAALLGFLMASSTDAKYNCLEEDDHLLWEGHCYKELKAQTSFEVVDSYCGQRHRGGHLVSIHSSDEEEALIDKFELPTWIGIYKEGGEWKWSDGSQVNYTNWDDQEDISDSDIYAYIPAAYPKKWRSVKSANFYNWICKYPAIDDEPSTLPKTSSSMSSTTEAPEATPHNHVFGCVLHTRSQCKAGRFLISAIENDPIHCQHLCSTTHSEDCQSFQFDTTINSCTLYTTPVGNLSDCQSVGGPDIPSISSCQSRGCQDFYSSGCNEEDLEPIEVIENVTGEEECQALCQEMPIYCSKWIMWGSTCKLYMGANPCTLLLGPKSPPIRDCL